MASLRHSFSGSAVATTLTSNLSNSGGSFTVASITNWPNTTIGPFVLTVDRGDPSLEEKVLVSSYSGNTVTVSERGYDNTTPVAHQTGAPVEHTLDAAIIDQANDVVNGVGSATPTTSAVGDAAATGTSPYPAADDHRHGREAFATGGTSTSSIGDTGTDGSSTSPARDDHQHARESAATVGATVKPYVLGLPLALTGAAQPTRYVGATAAGAPTTGSFNQGDFVLDDTGALYVCTAGGSQGTWTLVNGAPTYGEAHLLTPSGELVVVTSYGDAVTPGPAVTLTTGTAVKVTVCMQATNTAANTDIWMSYAVSSSSTVAATDDTAIRASSGAGGTWTSGSYTSVLTGLTAGSNIFTAKYRVDASSALVSRRRILVERLN
jgi:hypothetical protein